MRPMSFPSQDLEATATFGGMRCIPKSPMRGFCFGYEVLKSMGHKSLRLVCDTASEQLLSLNERVAPISAVVVGSWRLPKDSTHDGHKNKLLRHCNALHSLVGGNVKVKWVYVRFLEANTTGTVLPNAMTSINKLS